MTSGAFALDAPLAGLAGARRSAPPCAIVVMGASGDLARRKLMPALYALAADGALGDRFSIIGAGRTAMTNAEFRTTMRDALITYGRLPFDPVVWQRVEPALRYVDVGPAVPDAYGELHSVLEWSDATRGTRGNRLVYLAIPPSAVVTTVEALAQARIVTARAREPFCRLVVEKPFGRDLASARLLNRQLHRHVPERALFRIDHYLGKESVQNLLVLRFANAVFEPIWNRVNVDHVQITVAETVGLEGRGAFYEEAGALRDMVQSHMLQLVSLVGMEAPVSLDADSIRDEKVKLLRAAPTPAAETVLASMVRAQYGPGLIDGTAVPGYRDEPGVDPRSQTETFVALRLDIDSWRWAGTPFYLRTGKRLPRRSSEITIEFRHAPQVLFGGRGMTPDDAGEANRLIIRIQPDEGITFCVTSKVPGATMRVVPVAMDFSYGSAFGTTPEAYERLLLDALVGDATLFAREDELEESWRVCTAILDAWAQARSTGTELPTYPAGTWGPAEADELLARDGRRWRNPVQPSRGAIARS